MMAVARLGLCWVDGPQEMIYQVLRGNLETSVTVSVTKTATQGVIGLLVLAVAVEVVEKLQEGREPAKVVVVVAEMMQVPPVVAGRAFSIRRKVVRDRLGVTALSKRKEAHLQARLQHLVAKELVDLILVGLMMNHVHLLELVVEASIVGQVAGLAALPVAALTVVTAAILVTIMMMTTVAIVVDMVVIAEVVKARVATVVALLLKGVEKEAVKANLVVVAVSRVVAAEGTMMIAGAHCDDDGVTYKVI